MSYIQSNWCGDTKIKNNTTLIVWIFVKIGGSNATSTPSTGNLLNTQYSLLANTSKWIQSSVIGCTAGVTPSARAFMACDMQPYTSKTGFGLWCLGGQNSTTSPVYSSEIWYMNGTCK